MTGGACRCARHRVRFGSDLETGKNGGEKARPVRRLDRGIVEPGEFQPAAGIQRHFRLPRDCLRHRLSLRRGPAAGPHRARARSEGTGRRAVHERSGAARVCQRVRRQGARSAAARHPAGHRRGDEGRAHRTPRARARRDRRSRHGDVARNRRGTRSFQAGRQGSHRRIDRHDPEPVLPGGACQPHPAASGRRSAARRARSLPHVLQGCARQARRRCPPVPRRRIQVGGRTVHPQRRLARIPGSRLVLDERRVVRLSGRHRRGAQARSEDDRRADRRLHALRSRRPAETSPSSRSTRSSSTSLPRTTRPCRC